MNEFNKLLGEVSFPNVLFLWLLVFLFVCVLWLMPNFIEENFSDLLLFNDSYVRYQRPMNDLAMLPPATCNVQ